jgi:hypothetical protein
MHYTLCVLSYLAEKTQDPDIKSAVVKFIDEARSVEEQICAISISVNHPIPTGFSAEDINLNAPKLYTDKFILIFIRNMSRFTLVSFCEACTSCSRSDDRAFFNQPLAF